MSEVWKQCHSNPMLWASNLGRVKSDLYTGTMPNGGERNYQLMPTYGHWSTEDERFIIVFRRKTYRVGRLVCEAFNGPPPFEKAVAMHMDEDSKNNLSSNLQWGTQKKNLNFPKFLAYCSTRKPPHQKSHAP